MQGIQSTIDAILMNNPSAVSTQLSALGLVPDDEILSPDQIKGVLQDVVNQLSDNESNQLAISILDVPINLEGEYAEQLLDFHIKNGNRIVVLNELMEYQDEFKDQVNKNAFSSKFSREFEYVAGAFLILLSLFLLKKIFFD